VITFVLLVLGLLVSAFFSAAETAMVSASRTRLSHRADEGEAGARRALAFLEDPRRLLGATLVGNNLANVFTATLATLYFVHRFGEGVVPWVVLGMAAVLLLVGEILPKSFARAHADVLAPRLVAPLETAYVAFRPIVGATNAAAAVLLKLVGARTAPGRVAMSRQDFQLLLDESEQSGQVAPTQGRILSRVMDFGETTAGQIMRPRTDILGVESGSSVRDVIAFVGERGFSRVPVFRGDLDHVLGVVHLFDLFRAPSPDLPVDRLLRPIAFVPESKRCDELLREMQASHRPLAIVVDEYGGTAGLVSVEDLVEELVGEIRNEDEPTLPPVRRLGPAHWAIDGSMRIEDVNEALPIDLPEGDYETVAGLLLERLGRIPQAGESVTVGGVRIEVLAADRRRVRSLGIQSLGRPPRRGRDAS
jgi:putative hemolysin